MMITAKEMIEMTVSKSWLAVVCDVLIEKGLEQIAKPRALEGKRNAMIGCLKDLPNGVRDGFSYDEIATMCKVKLEAIGYSVEVDTQKNLKIFW